MAEHTFLVTVEVDDWPDADPEYHRTEAQYARAAINTASLRDAEHLDGFADLKADAWITEVEEL